MSVNEAQRVFMLVGPKGSGKSYVGSMIEKLSDHRYAYLAVEMLWLNLRDGEDGWQKVLDEVDRILRLSSSDDGGQETMERRDGWRPRHRGIVIETLGAGPGFERQYQALVSSRYRVKLIRVQASLDACLERVRKRQQPINAAQQQHIPVPLDKVREYNQIASAVRLPWDATLSNDPFLSEQELSEFVQHVMDGMY